MAETGLPAPLFLGAFLAAQVVGWVDVLNQGVQTLLQGRPGGGGERDSASNAALEARRADKAARRAAAAARRHRAAAPEARAAEAAAKESRKAAAAAAHARHSREAERAAQSAAHYAGVAEVASSTAEAAAAASAKGGEGPEEKEVGSGGRLHSSQRLGAQAAQAAPAAVLLLLGGLLGALVVRSRTRAAKAGAAAPIPTLVDEVLDLLQLSTRTRAEEARLSALMLLISQSQPPKGSTGPSPREHAEAWEVVWTQQPLFFRGLWGAQHDASAQRFCTATGSLSASSDLGFMRLTARGRFTPTEDSGAWGDKQVYNAGVDGGELALAGGAIKLPLWLLGSAGSWTVVYADARLRVFRSAEMGLAAQCPAEALKRHDSAASFAG